ncbi:hypothetical protein H0H81_003466 [Sphagnurus paluster]|uniref:Fungal-type protein kinase domain-containing protein n=1 Tax=Sphagnurus paluster TaxID=117069 RepID=A0A9P7GM90_9AGAR|nr:hypothetical protein H0H81_003466 [Sphagnurus paluster]
MSVPTSEVVTNVATSSPTQYPAINGFEAKRIELSEYRRKLNRTMRGKFVGPMPPSEFLDEFVAKPKEPMPPVANSPFERMEEGIKTEVDMYPKFVTTNLIPGYEIVDTSNFPDRDLLKSGGWKVKPDPTMYRKGAVTEENVTQWDKAEINFEFKLKDSGDPFQDPGRKDNLASWNIESSSNESSKNRAQLIHYATEWMQRSQRCFAFTIFIAGKFMCFIRWDRAGVVVSERFDYHKDSHHFLEFLWRFTHLNEAGRGFDTTVRLASPAEVDLAKNKLSKWAPKDQTTPVFVFLVPDGNIQREFIGWGLTSYPESLAGRCTRGHPVYEAQTETRCFLKDGWRAHDVARDLQAHKVPNILGFVCGGDVEEQATLTDLFVPVTEIDAAPPPEVNPSVPVPVPVHLRPLPPRRLSPWLCGHSWRRVTRRIHHRFIVDFIGKPLTDFPKSQIPFKCVADAFLGHEKAYECGWLHRDISVRNILIHDDGRGILNDWDLAKRRDELHTSRRHEKTGTWQFMSCLLLMDHHSVHTVQDDMESFVYVLLYLGLRYLKHKKPRETLHIMSEIFDYEKFIDGNCTGGENKRFMIESLGKLGRDFHFACEPLDDWFRIIRELLREWIEYVSPHEPTTKRSFVYRENNVPAKPTPRPPIESLALYDHKAMAELFPSALDPSTVWPLDDAAQDCLPGLLAKQRTSVKRRFEESAHNGAERKPSILRRRFLEDLAWNSGKVKVTLSRGTYRLELEAETLSNEASLLRDTVAKENVISPPRSLVLDNDIEAECITSLNLKKSYITFFEL